ncbi:hypothetical protein AAL_05301 [Moelleriella libera RCEF 2490]|uniref:Uncharacterized protein n=1 Tax=Moelleriella libera RCEF 2490 TaxID=1081109 RepID=A0A168ATK3_9HYPO|nr:hypothetical protein AAL_05301 [Moelleriella libera RCEF 2490]
MAALGNLVQLLRLGGYLQWAEPDVASSRFEKSRPDNHFDALKEMFGAAKEQDARLRPTWIPKLPDLFREARLELVQEDVKDAPGYLARAMYECGLVIPQMLASHAGNVALQENIRRLMPMVEQETKQGALLAFTRWTVIGRKPL